MRLRRPRPRCALTLELAGCCLEAGIWCSEAILSRAVCFCRRRAQELKLPPRILLALSPWPWGRAPCLHPVPAAAEPHRGAQRREQCSPRPPHISPGAAAAPSPSLALHGPGPCSELFTGQSPPVPHGGVPVTVPAQSHLRWGCGGAQPGARARVSLGWSRDALRASQLLLVRLFPRFLLSELQPRHPSSELLQARVETKTKRRGQKEREFLPVVPVPA